MQNRYLWNRFKHEEQLIEQQGTSANAKWLWHGTSNTHPLIVCGGVDGVDFRMVRAHVCVCVCERTGMSFVRAKIALCVQVRLCLCCCSRRVATVWSRCDRHEEPVTTDAARTLLRMLPM